MMNKKDLVAIFDQTRTLSNTQYYKDTDHLKRNTYVFPDAMTLYTSKGMMFTPKIEFVHGGTVNTAMKEKKNGSMVAMLNFADAHIPGGMVLNGAPTQEENICRCSNLYESLTLDKCFKEYYGVNNNQIHRETNAMIYSYDVTVFRDDMTYDLLDEPEYIDVITIPAPVGQYKGIETVLEYRIACMLAAAQYFDIETLVLGAWGCGAFGQDLDTVARCFARMIKRYPIVPKIVFAIRSTFNDKTKTEFETFKQSFEAEYLDN